MSIKKISIKILTIIILYLLIFIIVIQTILFYQNFGSVHADGTPIKAKSMDLIITKGLGIIVSLPIISLMLGGIVALFIERDTLFINRYIKSFLIVLSILYSIIIIKDIISLASLL